MKSLPRRGHDAERILGALEDLTRGDVQWRRGRAFGLVFNDDGEVAEIGRKAYLAAMQADGLHADAFPSIRRLEAEVVSMTAGLLGGNDDVAGTVTSSGVESILLAVLAARERAREQRPKLTNPEMILPRSAHPAFALAGHLLGVEPVLTPLDSDDCSADMKGVTRALNERTILIVASAPTLAHGAIDPVSGMARLAAKRGILCHVDANLGGMILPFLRALDQPVPPFDLEVEGVTSISTNLHGYGAAPLGASVLLFRDPSLRRHQLFATTDWPGGLFATGRLAGSRPGGAVAAAWAVMHMLGFEGYADRAGELLETTRALRRGIEGIAGFHLLGHPVVPAMAFTSSRHDLHAVADHLTGRGWHLARQQHPTSLGLVVTRPNRKAITEFLQDLEEAAQAAAQEPVERILDRTRDIVMGAATRFLPKRFVNHVTSIASERLGVSESELLSHTPSLYGLAPSVPLRADLAEAALDTFDELTRYDPSLGEILE